MMDPKEEEDSRPISMHEVATAPDGSLQAGEEDGKLTWKTMLAVLVRGTSRQRTLERLTMKQSLILMYESYLFTL